MKISSVRLPFRRGETTRETSFDREHTNWYISRAFEKLRATENAFERFEKIESIDYSFEAIEFSLKALCKIRRVPYPRNSHCLSDKVLNDLAKNLGEEFGVRMQKELLLLLPEILGCTDELREIAHYGIDYSGSPQVSPGAVFGEAHPDKVIKLAKKTCNILHQVEIRERWNESHPILIGILNGFIEHENEHKCKPRWSTGNTEFWEDYLSNIKVEGERKKYEAVPLYASQISNKYALILNPFGENYPEWDTEKRGIFHRIVSYIQNGGIFANTSGLPFFSAWDVQIGKENEISEKRILIPKRIETHSPYEGVITEWQESIQFQGTLFYKIFDAVTTYDVENHKESVEEEAYQLDQDINSFGSLLEGVDKVREFRALRANSPNAIPLIRAKCKSFGEIFPVAAIRKGMGFLLVAGMDMLEEKGNRLFANALDAFCNWMIGQI